MKLIDLTGQRFGRLVVLRLGDTVKKKRRWLCLCDCGTEKMIYRDVLISGTGKSCGCLNSEITTARNYKHGKAWTRVWRIWNGMVRRCTDSNHTRWKWYGGRGIKVCERWLKFENFYADMGDCPSDEHSIERVDVNGNYEPSNCIWLLLKDQRKNCRPRALDPNCPKGHPRNARRRCPVCDNERRNASRAAKRNNEIAPNV